MAGFDSNIKVELLPLFELYELVYGLVSSFVSYIIVSRDTVPEKEGGEL